MGARRLRGALVLAVLLTVAAPPGSAAIDLVLGEYGGGDAAQAYDVSGDIAVWMLEAETQRVGVYDLGTGETTEVEANPDVWHLGQVRVSGTTLVSGDASPYDYGAPTPSPSGGWYEAIDLATGTVLNFAYGARNRYGFDVDEDLLAWSPLVWTLDSLNRAELAFLVTSGLSGGSAYVPTGPAEPTFSDVAPTHWAYDSIEYAVALGLISGYGDGTYHPYWSVDRATAAVAVARAAGGVNPPSPPTPTFQDVPADHWAYPSIEYLSGIVFDVAAYSAPPRFEPESTADAFITASWVTQATGTFVPPGDMTDIALSVSALNVSGGAARALSTPAAVAEHVVVDQGRVVWQDFRDGQWDIYFAGVGPDGRVGTADDWPEVRVTDSPAHDTRPALSGRYLVWESRDGGPTQVLAHDLGPDLRFGTADDGETGPVSPSAREQRSPGVGTRYVTWEDDLAAGRWQVFAYGLGPDGLLGTADDREAAQLTTAGNGTRRRWPRLSGDRLLYSEGARTLHLYDVRDYGIVAGFAGSPLSGDRPLVVSFTDQTTGAPSGHLTAWEWSFGDGGTSTQQSPTYTYAVPGVYDVSLTVWSGISSSTATESGYVTVTEPGSARIGIEHPMPSQLVIDVGWGDIDHPTWVKRVWDREPTSDQEVEITADLAGSGGLPPGGAQPWFVQARDMVTGNAGFITGFEISFGGESYQAADVPKLIVDDGRTVTAWIPEEPHNVALMELIVTPNVVNAGGQAELSVEFSDNRGDEAASWQWDDGGAGGAFCPTAAVQNPTYTAPADPSGDELTVTLTVTVACNGAPPATETASTTLLVTEDFDQDGMPDSWEAAHGLNPLSPLDAALDPDNDGLTNLQEFNQGTDPRSRDTDADGFGDGEEVSLGSDPADRDSVPAAGHFTDVSPTGSGDGGDEPFWAFHSIEAAFRAGIVQGYSDGTYQPSLVVTRDQMAVYIARAVAGGDDSVPSGPVEPSFTDVGEDHWAYHYIEYCSAQNIVQGYSDGAYRPGDPVDRGQMAVYVARAVVAPIGDAAFLPPAAPGSFPDVPGDYNEWSWCWPHVEFCYTREVVQGYSDGLYHPDLDVTRDQMAVYIQRAFDLPM
jgi:PKD repeat protein